MPRQANIVSFDAARRAAAGTRAPQRGASGRFASGDGYGGARPGRVLLGGDQSAIVGGPPRGSVARPVPSWYDAGAYRPRPDDGYLSGAARRSAREAEQEAGEDYEERLLAAMDERNASPLGRLRARRRERAKERAGAAYFRQYEAGKAAEGAQGGPRAAVYKGEMGASHRRSARMQQATADASPRRGARAHREGRSFVRGPLMGLAVTALCLAFGVAFLYGPAQQLYTDIRERDRLSAELLAVTERNEAIGAQVEALQTDAGIEDAARTQLGWVREGEHAVAVNGLDEREGTEFRGNIVSEDIELPDTWYSGVLDPLFGVE